MKKFEVVRRLPSGEVGRLGIAVHEKDGWIFYPNVSGRRKSVYSHWKMTDCLPRWVGYPKNCELRKMEKKKDG